MARRSSSTPTGPIGPPTGLDDDGPMADLVLRIATSTAALEGRWIEAFHRQYVAALPHVLGTEQGVWRETRQSVADLAELGVEWFDSTKLGGNVMELVTQVAVTTGYAFAGVHADRKGEVSDALDSLEEFLGSAGDVRTLIDSHAPPNPRETGVPDSVQGVKAKISQSLEHTIDDSITYTEERVATVLRAAVTQMSARPAILATGDRHLARIADASHVLSRQQTLTEHGVAQAVSGLLDLSDQVTAAASGICTSVQPFVRPACVGSGSDGPYDLVLALENATSDAMHDTASKLERVASAVRIAADHAFAADADSAGALEKADQKLERTQQEHVEQVRPPTRAGSPSTPPDVEVHVEVPDCAPPDLGLGTSPVPDDGSLVTPSS